jgi:hypothetical protein
VPLSFSLVKEQVTEFNFDLSAFIYTMHCECSVIRFYSSTPPKTTSSDESNAVHQGAAPNIPSTSNSEITPASNNSAGTSQGQSSNPNEDPESKRLSLDLFGKSVAIAFIYTMHVIYISCKKLHRKFQGLKEH